MLTACENFGIDDPQLPQIEVIGGEDALSLTFPSDEVLTKTVTFKSNYDWSVTTSDEWIKVTPENGKAGEVCEISVSLAENETHDTRRGKVVISIKELSIELDVVQLQKNALMLTTTKVNLPQAGGSFEVVIKSNIEYEYEIKADWIKSVESRALVENSLRFEAEVNPTTDVRIGEIVFKGGDFVETMTVVQSQTNVITLSTSTIELDTEGGNFFVEVSSNVEYNIIIEEACDWITLVDSRAVTTSKLNFVASDNTSGTDRTATITISGEELSETITISQKYKEPAPQSNEIWYTSTDGAVVEPYATDVFGANIVSNTYENGKGVITFDGSVTQIGERAFYAATKTAAGRRLASITIPDSVTSIGDTPFARCISLSAFYGKYASMDNRCLIVDKVLIAFASSGLTEYTIPDGITSIGNSALAYSTSLTSITIPNGIVSIGKWALRACKLTSITIPDSVIEIGSAAFYNCPNLTAFYGKFASADNRCLVVDGVLNSFAPSGLAEYTIPDSVTSIGDYAFGSCAKLTSVTIPDSVTSIGGSAFNGCSGELIINSKIVETNYSSNDYPMYNSNGWLYGSKFTKLTIGDNITKIGDSAFYHCNKLTCITIPNSVTSIVEYAFRYCDSLTSVYCKPTTPPTGDYDMFYYNASGRKIYVPRNSVSTYKSASYWSNYASYIEGYDF